MSLTFTVTPVARGFGNVFKVEVWKAGVAVATLWRRNETDANYTGRRYARLLGGSDG
jgi:hypothetical protein